MEIAATLVRVDDSTIEVNDFITYAAALVPGLDLSQDIRDIAVDLLTQSDIIEVIFEDGVTLSLAVFPEGYEEFYSDSGPDSDLL